MVGEDCRVEPGNDIFGKSGNDFGQPLFNRIHKSCQLWRCLAEQKHGWSRWAGGIWCGVLQIPCI